MVESRAKWRLALAIAAPVAFAALTMRPLYACDSIRGCPADTSNLNGVAANALPTYAQPTEEKAAEPVALKKFAKSQTRAARRAQSRKAMLSQRARAGKYAARKAKQIEQQEAETEARASADKKVAPTVANAKAELVEAQGAKPNAAETGTQPAASETPAAQPPTVELVAPDEFNDLDRVAWEKNQMPKLMQLSALDSRAELRDDDSKWAQTSMIGKLFVAFGALLTIGSAIRMFMA